MNAVLLNTINLDGGVIIKKGSGGGGGVTIKNQSKSVEITENGTTEVRYDAGYTGLEKVSVNVNVVSDNDIAETDAEVCRLFFNAGLCANENYITKEEAARITDSDLVSFSQNLSIRTFNGFKYFTSITKLSDSLFNNSTLLSIELPAGLTSIGSMCFMGTPLQSIKIPSGVTSIGKQAFMSCGQLNSIELPAGLTSIGSMCFVGCVNLTKITSLATTAPNADATAFGPNESFAISKLVGRNTYNTGENMLYVPAGATGYDTGAWLDPLQNPEMCGFTIKYQGEINNQDKVVDIVENGSTEVVADAGFTGLGKVTINTNVASSGGGSGWTGHADAEGLKAIGWTDEDIAYYQEHGVNWNEEDDEYHKVTDDNKALYGVLTADNISTYRDRIVYFPKIDTSGKTTMQGMFYDCPSLVAIPQLNTVNVTDMSYMFSACSSLKSIPMLDTQNVTNMSNMFYQCYSLVSIPQLDTQKVTDMSNMFYQCYSLVSIPQLDTSNVTDMSSMFRACFALVYIPQLDTANVDNISQMVYACYSLTHVYLKNAKSTCPLNGSALLSKESLLYIINNEAATSAITITLHSCAYTRLANDADVVAALAAHPNISIAQ